MVSTSNADSADVDDRILRAAEECVLHFGLERVTVAEIARRARVSRPTVYRRWPDVHAILATMFSTRVLEILQQVPDQGDDRQAIVSSAVATVSLLRHDSLVNAGLGAAPESALRNISERLGAGIVTLIDALAAAVAVAQQGGSIRAGDPRLLAAMVVVAAQAAVQSAALLVPILDEAALDAELAHLLDSYLA